MPLQGQGDFHNTRQGTHNTYPPQCMPLIANCGEQIELRNGQAFVIDNRSTNGSQLNGEDLVGGTPYRLKEGDVITMGTTELLVSIAEASGANQENTFSNN